MRLIHRFLAICCLVAAVALAAHADAWRFIVTSDHHCDTANQALLPELATAIPAEHPDLVLVCGDLATNTTVANLQKWATTFMDPVQNAGIPVYPIRGNHDSSVSAWNSVFSGARALPSNGPTGEENRSYTVTHKNACFIALDEMRPGNEYTMNETWLQEQMAAATEQHIFVFGHVPLFSLASSTAGTPWDLLAEGHCSAYICGHYHVFDNARYANDQGQSFEHLICGSGGNGASSWPEPYPIRGFARIEQSGTYGYMVVDVDGITARVTYKQRTAPGVYTAISGGNLYTLPGYLPTASFSLEPAADGQPPQLVCHDASAPGNAPITDYLWNFGDGTTSVEQDPVHIYANPGMYSVSLTATNAYGSDTHVWTTFVAVPLPALGGFGTAALVGFVGVAGCMRRRIKKQ